jgi:hypothetical protein
MSKSEKELLDEVQKIIEKYLKESYQGVLMNFANGIYPDIIQNPNPNSNSNPNPNPNPITKPKSTKSNLPFIPINPNNPIKNDFLLINGYKLSKSKSTRRKTLKKMTKSVGTFKTLKMLNLTSIYLNHTQENHLKLKSDIEYLKYEYAKEKNRFDKFPKI